MIKLLKEDEKTIVEPIPVDQPALSNGVDTKTLANACEEAVNNLMRQAWDFVSDANSVIATLELNYAEDSKKDIIELLNAVVDDSTINIGILQKITNVMNDKKVDLLDAGEDKADKILTGEADSK